MKEILEELKKDVNDCVFFTSTKSSALVKKEDVFKLIDELLERFDNSDYAKCSHKYVDAQGVGGGYIFKYCNICGKTKHFA